MHSPLASNSPQAIFRRDQLSIGCQRGSFRFCNVVSCYWALIDGSVPEDQADIAGVGFRVSNEFEGDCPKRGDADELKHAVGCLVYSVEEDIVGFESIVVDGVVGDAGDGASQVSLIAPARRRKIRTRQP